ncbi:hypothetical protein V8G54_030302 [Vigna mungo]|uniref:ABC transporter domain-containing protein n=1 Tax=Vigna mungo TaxID=3915 RepID=A0AAQ3MW52_VIGMU
MVEEASRMEVSSRGEGLDRDAMKGIESDDYAEYLRTELVHQTVLSQDPNNIFFFPAMPSSSTSLHTIMTAFSPLKLRLGGSLQDKLIYGTYGTEDYHQPCTPFVKEASEMFGFTQGIPPMLYKYVCNQDNALNRYTDTLKACALDVDVSLMIKGDMAYIGEKRVNLSGGQRARLALARC